MKPSSDLIIRLYFKAQNKNTTAPKIHDVALKLITKTIHQFVGAPNTDNLSHFRQATDQLEFVPSYRNLLTLTFDESKKSKNLDPLEERGNY